tara:strand:+ start:637 stop:1668 length:1032 start_codon:yes stop_codon:yes gene_type:complete
MNLKEFSKKIGLPVSTISKALGGYKDVNIRTKNKIKTLAKKHNYSPNLHAKNLASRNILSVGFVLPTQDNFIHKLSLIEFIQNIHSELNKINVPVVMIFAKNKHDEIESYKKLINYHKVKLIILNDTKKNDERISFLDKYNMPYLTWGRTNKNKKSYTWIDEDVDYTTKIAIDYIISNGHKKICLISSMDENNYFHLRQKSFSNYCKKNNITFKKKQLLKLQADNFNLEKNKLIKFLKKNKETSLYLILSEQFLNIVLESFKETKKEIGKDVSVISFDSNLVESLAPNITTISQPVNDVKKNLTQLIINKLQNINSNNYYLYKSKLIKKKSVINIVKKTLIKN